MRPNILGDLDAQTSSRLGAAFRLAAERLSDSPRCAAMFSKLGADGLARLRETHYLPAAETGAGRVCSRSAGAAAFTTVGNSRTVICPGLVRLNPKEAAVIVLHEALHFAGLPESPSMPGAMTSAEINDWVADRCGL